jgi:hypothetical protein
MDGQVGGQPVEDVVQDASCVFVGVALPRGPRWPAVIAARSASSAVDEPSTATSRLDRFGAHAASLRR